MHTTCGTHPSGVFFTPIIHLTIKLPQNRNNRLQVSSRRATHPTRIILRINSNRSKKHPIKQLLHTRRCLHIQAKAIFEQIQHITKVSLDYVGLEALLHVSIHSLTGRITSACSHRTRTSAASSSSRFLAIFFFTSSGRLRILSLRYSFLVFITHM